MKEEYELMEPQIFIDRGDFGSHLVIKHNTSDLNNIRFNEIKRLVQDHRYVAYFKLDIEKI